MRAALWDVPAMARILWQFEREADWLPRVRSPLTELRVLAWAVVRGTVRAVRAHDARGRLRAQAFIIRRGERILALYTSGGARRAGYGRMLVQEAQRQSARLQLFAAQDNAGARRFYAAMGFAEAARSDGRYNDEGLPDIHFVWTRAPSGIARAQIGQSAPAGQGAEAPPRADMGEGSGS